MRINREFNFGSLFYEEAMKNRFVKSQVTDIADTNQVFPTLSRIDRLALTTFIKGGAIAHMAIRAKNIIQKTSMMNMLSHILFQPLG